MSSKFECGDINHFIVVTTQSSRVYDDTPYEKQIL